MPSNGPAKSELAPQEPKFTVFHGLGRSRYLVHLRRPPLTELRNRLARLIKAGEETWDRPTPKPIEECISREVLDLRCKEIGICR
jgi:hypothetical protein